MVSISGDELTRNASYPQERKKKKIISTSLTIDEKSLTQCKHGYHQLF
jgi:hypothetical protein